MLLQCNKQVMLALIIAISLFSGCRKEPDAADASLNDSIAAQRRRPRVTSPTTPTDTTVSGAATVAGTLVNFTEIPYSNTDLINPGRGVEQWHNANEVNVPTEGVNTQRLDMYYRFSWVQFEGATQGAYTWSQFDNMINTCIQKKQKFSFGIMTLNPDGGGTSYGGGSAYYPQYLHNMMQAESTKDWLRNGVWVPNYNSPSYQARLLALHQAINAHLESGSYNGVAYKDVIGYIDIRGYGSWGEWHHGSLISNMSEFPSGTMPTATSLKKIIDAHLQGLPNYRFVAMIAGYDAGSTQIPLFYSPAEVAYYLLTARNNAGDIGIRRDQWGATDSYLSGLLENNTASYNGVALKTLIMNKWQTAPVVGEPPSWNDNNYAALESQVRLYHATSFGNGNYGTTINSTIATNVRAASKASGYRIKILSAQGPQTITRNTPFAIASTWQNVGIAPAYDNWDVVFELQDASSIVKWSGTSTRVLKLFLPSTAGATTTDNFTIPSTVVAGTYKLVVRVKDPKNFRPNMQLAVNGKNADNSYTIYSTVTVK
jgi:hypothetical protein